MSSIIYCLHLWKLPELSVDSLASLRRFLWVHERSQYCRCPATFDWCARRRQLPSVAWKAQSGHELTWTFVRSNRSTVIPSYLEGLPKFVAHDGVEQRIDARGQVVEHTGYVGHNQVNVVKIRIRVRNVRIRSVNCHQALRVERSPTEEEGDHDGHWKKGEKGSRVNYLLYSHRSNGTEWVSAWFLRLVVETVLFVQPKKHTKVSAAVVARILWAMLLLGLSFPFLLCLLVVVG